MMLYVVLHNTAGYGAADIAKARGLFNKNAHVAKVFQRIRSCRTAALGYHVYQCTGETVAILNINIIVAGIAIVLIVAQ